MSWLLAAFIPALLMLATFGLQRLESNLENEAVSAADVAEFLDQAEADDVNTLAREGMGSALDGLHKRLGEQEWTLATAPAAREMSSLPNRLVMHHRANPEFQPTRHANRV
ncbi:hypothetical protein GGC64_004290 [Mycobacterium sp. OAS707]|uniref:hypothetical protein n=1 Tax=Mycobacterium sp. OAS707 TaxID=2663822 RepID=UPI00178A89E9|nr:hypothetical protein [Mycobacterium sp. OAS707]